MKTDIYILVPCLCDYVCTKSIKMYISKSGIVFFSVLSSRGSRMHLRLYVTSFVLAETRPVSYRRFPSLTRCWPCWSRKWPRHSHTHTLFPFESWCGVDDVLPNVFLQAGVCGAAAAEHVFRREDWKLHRQWDSSSFDFAGNSEACVSESLNWKILIYTNNFFNPCLLSLFLN